MNQSICARMNEVLASTTPLRREEIIRSLRVLSPEPLTEASSRPALPPLRILMAEDNVVNQKVALLMLTLLGQETPSLAYNGIQAIEAVEKDAPYDLILMDIGMPEMDGIEAARRIRQQCQGGKRPFLAAVTAYGLVGDRERHLQLGFDGYLAKPLQIDGLQALLKQATPRRPASL